jgi:uncharacterized protein (TIGR02266 family)
MGAARRLELEVRDLDEPFLEEKEDRQHARANVNGEIDIYSETNFWTGLTMNISEGGVFVATHMLLPMGAMVVLNLTLEGETIATLGQVRWTRDFCVDSDVPPGIGIQFVNLDKRMLFAIRRFMATVREPLLFEDGKD